MFTRYQSITVNGRHLEVGVKKKLPDSAVGVVVQILADVDVLGGNTILLDQEIR